jgi:transcriptional regulator with XRE-family HTH domain
MKKNNGVEVDSLAARIKRLRLTHGLTQGQLAASIGISQTAVGKWESGEFFPKGRHLEKLAEGLGIDVAELMGATPKSIDDLAAEVRLLVAFRVLPKERQLIAIQLVEALKLTGN